MSSEGGHDAGAIHACRAMKDERVAGWVAEPAQCLHQAHAAHVQIPEVALGELSLEVGRDGLTLTPSI